MHRNCKKTQKPGWVLNGEACDQQLLLPTESNDDCAQQVVHPFNVLNVWKLLNHPGARNYRNWKNNHVYHVRRAPSIYLPMYPPWLTYVKSGFNYTHIMIVPWHVQNCALVIRFYLHIKAIGVFMIIRIISIWLHMSVSLQIICRER